MLKIYIGVVYGSVEALPNFPELFCRTQLFDNSRSSILSEPSENFANGFLRGQTNTHWAIPNGHFAPLSTVQLSERSFRYIELIRHNTYENSPFIRARVPFHFMLKRRGMSIGHYPMNIEKNPHETNGCLGDIENFFGNFLKTAGN